MWVTGVCGVKGGDHRLGTVRPRHLERSGAKSKPKRAVRPRRAVDRREIGSRAMGVLRLYSVLLSINAGFLATTRNFDNGVHSFLS